MAKPGQVTTEERAAVAGVVAAKAAEEKAAKTVAPIHDGKKLILQSIPVGKDTKDVKRTYAPLTPSMCTFRNCGFDAAKELGIAAGYDAAPLDQVVNAAGQTVKERMAELLDVHVNNIHNAPQLDHIIDADEAQRRAWAPGQHLRI